MGYTQLFREGSIEAVDLWLLRNKEESGKAIPNIKFERELVSALKHYLSVLEKIGVEPPIFAMLSILGVKGYYMLATSYEGYKPSIEGIDRENLILPEVVIDTYDVDPSTVMKPVFDSVWNACGWKRSINYDDAGRWKLND